jgi:3-oxoadipate enol-lactonase
MTTATSHPEELGETLLRFRPLINALDNNPSVPFASKGSVALPTSNLSGRIEDILGRFTDRLGIRRVTLDWEESSPKHTIFERALQHHLQMRNWSWVHEVSSSSLSSLISNAITHSIKNDFDVLYNRQTITTHTSDTINAYCAGSRAQTEPPVLLILPCGMPAGICRPWIDPLSRKNFVLTWESRRMFPGPPSQDLPQWDIRSQAEDAIALLNHFDVSSAHVIGLCGGAAIAVVLAALYPTRVRTLSLWHGDYYLGTSTPQTQHQENLRALLDFAARSVKMAASIHSTVALIELSKELESLSPFLLYPFANSSLLHSYGRLNGAIMNTDISEYVSGLRHPSLVVTSKDDTTAHPEISHIIASMIPTSRLLVRPTGSHLDLFQGEFDFAETASKFIVESQD